MGNARPSSVPDGVRTPPGFELQRLGLPRDPWSAIVVVPPNPCNLEKVHAPCRVFAVHERYVADSALGDLVAYLYREKKLGSELKLTVLRRGREVEVLLPVGG